MLRKLLCFIFLITSVPYMAGQDLTRAADSLKNILPKLKQDTTRVKTLNRIALHTGGTDPGTTEKFAIEALELSKKLSFDSGIIESSMILANAKQHAGDVKGEFEYLSNALEISKRTSNSKKIAEVYLQMGLNQYAVDYNKSIQYFNNALQITESIKDYKRSCDILVQLGGVYQYKGKLYEAADCFRKVITIGEKNKDEGVVLNGLYNLANIYFTQRNFDKSLEYKLKALEFANKNNSKSIYFLLIDIGNLYVEKGIYNKALSYYTKAWDNLKNSDNDYAKVANLVAVNTVCRYLNQQGKAEEALQEASAITEKIKSKYAKMQAYQMLGEANFAAQKYESALQNHLKALKAEESIGIFEERAIHYGNIGATYYMLAKQPGKLKSHYTGESIKYLTKAIPDLKKLNNTIKLYLYSQYLADVYELSGQPELALKTYKESVIYKDSVYNKEKREAFILKESEYEYNKKEALLKEKQKAEIAYEKSMRNFSYGGIAMLLFVVAGTGYGYINKRKDNRIIANEKKRSDELLLNILPHEVAEELKEKGEAAAHYYEHVSILFTDFEDFTNISGKMSPQEVISELNYCFKAFDQIITKYKIEKIKTIGDAYMAVSGLPSSSPDHAINIVKAAVEIRDFILDYKEQRKREGKIYFEMRIGINSGEVVAGIVGIKKFAYDIWGDAVNIAARMESNGVVGKINISESTYELVKHEFAAEYRGEIEAKGKGKVKMYFVEPKTSGVGI